MNFEFLPTDSKCRLIPPHIQIICFAFYFHGCIPELFIIIVNVVNLEIFFCFIESCNIVFLVTIKFGALKFCSSLICSNWWGEEGVLIRELHIWVLILELHILKICVTILLIGHGRCFCRLRVQMWVWWVWCIWRIWMLSSFVILWYWIRSNFQLFTNTIQHRHCLIMSHWCCIVVSIHLIWNDHMILFKFVMILLELTLYSLHCILELLHFISVW